MDAWEIKISDLPGRYAKALYIFRRTHDRKIVVQHGDTEDTYELGTDIKPTLLLEPDLLQALADELQALNVKPKDAPKIEGLYEAQSKHLADLRFMLKLK